MYRGGLVKADCVSTGISFFRGQNERFRYCSKNVSKSVRDRFEIVDLGFNLLAENMGGFCSSDYSKDRRRHEANCARRMRTA